ncbi:hypothetical protein F2P56_004111 [Juglans regia]|uniref:RNase H type-1 domain-containing protein n=2 Tax=Juglans regia TaxID=51240 RepID=A0A834D186_JUGRE|nr:uncharacterized protein LOC109004942 [Juglans regia]KAF5477474.1 hypothetical protein F2P56_004111 [Juglans regia]
MAQDLLQKVTSLGVEANVSELIIKELKIWNEDLIREKFNRKEADLMCSLPISNRGGADKIIWNYSKDGKFSREATVDKLLLDGGSWNENLIDEIFSVEEAVVIKTLTYQSLSKFLGGCSNHQHFSQSLKRIWPSQVPHAVKVFLWRAVSEALPTKCNLFKRKISVNEIWLRRNIWVFYDLFDSPSKLWQKAKLELEAFQQAQIQDKAACVDQNVSRRLAQWSRLEGDCVKANWDAAFISNGGKMGGGCVFRNSSGELLAAVGWPRSFIGSPLQAEAVALERTIELCVELGFQQVVFEGDSLNLVQDILSIEENRSWYGQIVEDLKSVFKHPTRRKIQFTPRHCNQVAHILARMALQLDDEAGHPLAAVFIKRSWILFIDQKDEGREIFFYIDIIFEFYIEIDVASRYDDLYIILVRGTSVTFSVDAVAHFIGIPQLPIAYPNVVPRESTDAGDGEMVEDKGIDVDGVDGLTDHEVQL